METNSESRVLSIGGDLHFGPNCEYGEHIISGLFERKEVDVIKVLFIGGTGNISVSVSKLAIARGIDLTLLNRGRQPVTIEGGRTITADITQPEQIRNALRGRKYDVVVNWIAFTEQDIERDLALFGANCGQYIFISSASAYQKPMTSPFITESTPLANPYWQYSRDKIRCEERLMRAYREDGFPVTIVRPSHTYDTRFPIAIGNCPDRCSVRDNG